MFDFKVSIKDLLYCWSSSQSRRQKTVTKHHCTPQSCTYISMLHLVPKPRMLYVLLLPSLTMSPAACSNLRPYRQFPLPCISSSIPLLCRTVLTFSMPWKLPAQYDISIVLLSRNPENTEGCSLHCTQVLPTHQNVSALFNT